MTSIRKRLTRSLLIALVGLLLCAGVGAFFLARAFLVAQFDSAARTKAQALTTLVDVEQGVVDFEVSDELMPEFAVGREGGFFEIWVGDRVLERSFQHIGILSLEFHVDKLSRPLL